MHKVSGRKSSYEGKFDMMHYKMRRIHYFLTAGIKHAWEAAASGDAGLSQRMFSYFPFGKSNITDD